jgi:hypothetical protein
MKSKSPLKALIPACALVLAACEGEVKQITFIAPPGSVIEYRLVPTGAGGSITLKTNQETVQVNAKAEMLEVSAFHAEGALRGSPVLRAEITQSASSGAFDPKVSKTMLSSSRAGNAAGAVEVRCKNLIDANGAEGSVVVSLQPPLSIGDCEDKAMRQQDPLWAGKGRGVGEGFNYFDESDDHSMGREFVNDFNAKNGNLLVRDRQVQPYLQGLMNDIAAKSDAPHIRPLVHFINADVVNAFALPGGPIYVFRGIMEYVRDEHELVGILGHEWAHVAARHGTRNVSKAINGQIAMITAAIALQVAAGNASEKDRKKAELIATAATLAAYGTTQYLVMAGGRDAEREADMLGAQYAYRIGYRPNGIADFFAALARDGGGGRTWLDSLFASHPEHSERVNNNQHAIASYFPGDAMSLPAQGGSYRNTLLAMRDLPPMLSGQEANKVLALKFVKTNQDVAHKAISGVLGTTFK